MKLTIGITGASGFIGGHLIAKLRESGHECVAFARPPASPVHGCKETRVMARERPLDLTRLDGIVNLAGENIMGFWTREKRRHIYGSRVRTTARLVETIGKLEVRPVVLVSASAVGIYGDRGDEGLNESSPPGSGFLAEVCRDWEAAALGAERFGVRVALVRLGFVLGPDGGPFVALRRAFRLCLGGNLGSGKQWMSPIHVDDVAGILIHFLEHPAGPDGAPNAGAFNAVCPQPLRNADFARSFARKLHRPAVLPAPAFALRTAFGELSRVFLDSERVLPVRTLASGYAFRFPDLASILSDLAHAEPAQPTL